MGGVAFTQRGQLSGTRPLGHRVRVSLEAKGLSATAERWPTDAMQLGARPQDADRGL